VSMCVCACKCVCKREQSRSVVKCEEMSILVGGGGIGCARVSMRGSDCTWGGSCSLCW